MRYRIDYADGKCCYVNSSKNLIERLKFTQDKKIADIQKLYKSGVSDSVKEKYQQYFRK